jgi:hypothetical protein
MFRSSFRSVAIAAGVSREEEHRDTHCFKYPEHLIVGAERTRVRDDSVVICLTFLWRQACREL